jgi:GNAT superfamily N-acetyltransferase
VDSFTIRRADPQQDNQALCTLARLCPQGSRLRFYHERTDHWERCRHFDDPEVWVAERNDQIIGAGSFGRKQVRCAGELHAAAYFLDRMVHPDHRRQGVGQAIVQRELLECGDTELQYGLVLEDNHANRRLLEGVGFICHPQRLLYFTIVPASQARRAVPDLHLIEPIPHELGELLDRRLHGRFSLMDQTAVSGMGLFVLGSPAPRAAAVLYRHGPKVVTQAPWYYPWLGRLLGSPLRVGAAVRTWLCGHLWYENARALAELLEGVALAAGQSDIQAILLPLAGNDPRLPSVRHRTLNAWGIPATAVCLYLRGELAETVLQARLPILHSPRDG